MEVLSLDERIRVTIPYNWRMSRTSKSSRCAWLLCFWVTQHQVKWLVFLSFRVCFEFSRRVSQSSGGGRNIQMSCSALDSAPSHFHCATQVQHESHPFVGDPVRSLLLWRGQVLEFREVVRGFRTWQRKHIIPSLLTRTDPLLPLRRRVCSHLRCVGSVMPSSLSIVFGGAARVDKPSNSSKSFIRQRETSPYESGAE
ncbi:hypothetical protein EXIGLDRAFT_202589 [Exidia glandulosa HHB12029]|uniref:Uncharacterized protein n=1 Tax=Exidia glandulosa HHB12029 TaxID=1314781 RepID=A0A165EPH4_EXIGL|nr:hypothetical protein EXIGLDRAFT_202589 [Exidia glandulosa HHB12029]